MPRRHCLAERRRLHGLRRGLVHVGTPASLIRSRAPHSQSHRSAPGQASCQNCQPFSTTSTEGMTGCDTRRAGVLFAQPTHPTPQSIRCLPNYYKTPFVRKNEAGDLIRCDNATALEESCAADSTQCFDQCCLSCEKGMVCDNPATNMLTKVKVEPDWWRLSKFSHKSRAVSIKF